MTGVRPHRTYRHTQSTPSIISPNKQSQLPIQSAVVHALSNPSCEVTRLRGMICAKCGAERNHDLIVLILVQCNNSELPPEDFIICGKRYYQAHQNSRDRALL